MDSKSLKRIGDASGCFIAIDKFTEMRTEVLWARLLIKLMRNPRPSVVNLFEGGRSFELQIWWKIPPWLAEVYPFSGKDEAKIQKEEDEVRVHTVQWVDSFCPNRNDGRLKTQEDVSTNEKGKGIVVT